MSYAVPVGGKVMQAGKVSIGNYVVNNTTLKANAIEIFKVVDKQWLTLPPESYPYDVTLYWQCVYHPKGNKEEHHGKDNEFYSKWCGDPTKKLIVLTHLEVLMYLMKA